MVRQSYVVKESEEHALGKLYIIPDKFMRLSGGNIINYEIGHCMFTIRFCDDEITAEINSMDGQSRLNKSLLKIRDLTKLNLIEDGN